MNIEISEQEATSIMRQLEEMPYKMVHNLIGFFQARTQEAREKMKAERDESLKEKKEKED